MIASCPYGARSYSHHTVIVDKTLPWVYEIIANLFGISIWIELTCSSCVILKSLFEVTLSLSYICRFWRWSAIVLLINALCISCWLPCLFLGERGFFCLLYSSLHLTLLVLLALLSASRRELSFLLLSAWHYWCCYCLVYHLCATVTTIIQLSLPDASWSSLEDNCELPVFITNTAAAWW